MAAKTKQLHGGSKESWTHNIKKYWPYYVMVLPGLIFFIVFKFIPMLGSVIAFQDYNIVGGIFKSQWVGLKHFKTLFQYPDFHRILKNTIFLGFCKTILIFPIPIMLSLMLNEIQNIKMKKCIQTAIYIPYFLSWVIVGGLIFDILGIGGLFNNIRNMLGMESVLLMQQEAWFRPIYIISSIWKEAGWGTVVYLAAMSGIDPALYESAAMDGAARFLYERYHLPILITENGMANLDFVMSDGKVHDFQRIEYMKSYLEALHHVMEDGIPVIGYTVWSIMDNFEWSDGFDPRFGLIYVDYRTQKRTCKDSFFWYQKVIKTSTLN